jgi:hypothetical protein
MHRRSIADIDERDDAPLPAGAASAVAYKDICRSGFSRDICSGIRRSGFSRDISKMATFHRG